MHFSDLNLESSSGCIYDYLEVRHRGPLGSVLGRYCGHSVPSDLTVTDAIWINFRSNAAITDQGFRAVWSPGTRSGSHDEGHLMLSVFIDVETAAIVVIVETGH